MKLRITIVSAALFAMLTTFFVMPGAASQNVARVDIPFAFKANAQVLPAGSYYVKLESNTMPILTLFNRSTSKSVGVMVHTGNGYVSVRHGVWCSASRPMDTASSRFGFPTRIFRATCPCNSREPKRNRLRTSRSRQRKLR